VRFLWAKNMEAKDIHKEMLPIYGQWQQMFCSGVKQSKSINIAWTVEILL
jgi:hypothetical protein